MALFNDNHNKNKFENKPRIIEPTQPARYIDPSNMTEEERVQFYKLQEQIVEAEHEKINEQQEQVILDISQEQEIKEKPIEILNDINNSIQSEEHIVVNQREAQELQLDQSIDKTILSEEIKEETPVQEHTEEFTNFNETEVSQEVENSSKVIEPIEEVVKEVIKETMPLVNSMMSPDMGQIRINKGVITRNNEYTVKESINGSPIDPNTEFTEDEMLLNPEEILTADVPAEESNNLALTIPLSDRQVFGETITALLEKYKDSPDELNKIMANPNSYFSHISNAYNALNAEQAFRQKALNKCDPNSFAMNIKELKDRLSNNVDTSKITDPNGYVSGQQASFILDSKLRGLKKVALLNSGFFITIRPFSNYELNEFVNSLYSETAEYGKMFGMHYYLFSDILVKKFIMDRLPDIIVSSNLEGWRSKQTLLDSISYADYNVIIWAIVSLMYKDGVKYTKVCGNPSCKYLEEVTINLNKLRYNNYKIVTTKDANKFMVKSTTLKPSDLAKYRELLVFDSKDVVEQDEWKFYLKIPSFNEYMLFADMFYNSLIRKCQVTDEDTVQDFLRYNFYCHFAPWISELHCYNDDGEILFKIKDSKTIMENLSKFEFVGTTFSDAVQDFIAASQISHIAFNYVACPKCNTVPSDVKDGFIAYDVQSAFFTMSVMKLRSAI